MASGYDITIKLYQNHVIERVMRAVDAINVLDVFLLWMLLMYSMYFVLVTLLVSVNYMLTICLFIIATPHHIQIVSFSISYVIAVRY